MVIVTGLCLSAVLNIVNVGIEDDSFASKYKDVLQRPVAEFSPGALRIQWNAAKKKNATIDDRFRFASYIVAAFDKKAISHGDSKYYAKEATLVLNSKELLLSPTYCYVVARLGLIHLNISAFETEAANRYYSNSKGGVSANILARVLSFNSSAAARAQSLTYALEAQAKQKDSVKLRWLVGGAYLFKADFTKERQYYEASIREYKCAIELAKAGKDKDFSDGNLETIRFYLEKAKDGLSKLKG